MTGQRDPERLIQTFLDEGEEQLDDRIYDAVRASIEQQRQRVFVGPWSTPTMNKFVTIGLGAAAVVVALLIGAQLLGSPGGGLGNPPSPSQEPTATAEPSASPISAPPLTQSFTSTLHGISVSYPEGWAAQAATEPWTADTFPLAFPAPQVDWLYDPVLEADLFLAIASQPIGDSTPDGWVGRQMASEEGCGASERLTLDGGGTGLIGQSCTVAVVATADRGYWIQLYTGNSAPGATYDLAWFEEFLDSVQLHPEDAVDEGPSSSP
jgi:hypothetical protein